MTHNVYIGANTESLSLKILSTSSFVIRVFAPKARFDVFTADFVA